MLMPLFWKVLRSYVRGTRTAAQGAALLGLDAGQITEITDGIISNIPGGATQEQKLDYLRFLEEEMEISQMSYRYGYADPLPDAASFNTLAASYDWTP